MFQDTELGAQIKQFDFTMGDTAAGLLAETVANFLMRQAEHYFLFIDDYHLMNDRRVLELIVTLADLPVNNLHMIIASRNAVLLQSTDIHLGQRLHVITTADLRLTHTELSFYCRRCGVTLNKKSNWNVWMPRVRDGYLLST